MTDSEGWIQNTQLLAPILWVIGTLLISLFSVLVTHYFTRRRQLEAEWRKDKLMHYSHLIESITEIMSMPKDFNKTYKQLAHSYNVVSLIAPQNVANIVFDFYRTVESSWEQDMLEASVPEAEVTKLAKKQLGQLILAMRKDLRIRPKDKPDTFKYKLRSPLYSE